MIALIIVAVILLLITAILILPLDIFISFKDDFYAEVRLFNIRVLKSESTESESDSKKSSKNNSDIEKAQGILKKNKKLFVFLKDKYGFLGATKSVLGLVKDVLHHIKDFLKHIKIKKIEFNLTIASSDAAQTAIDYGIACAAVYPVMAFLSSCAKIEFKSINVKSDFTSNKSSFDFSGIIRMSLIHFLIVEAKFYEEYNQFLLKENYNERQQN